MTEKEIGKTIRRRREELCVTQKRLAEISGVSENTLTRLENGENVRIDTILLTAQALGLTVKILRENFNER